MSTTFERVEAFLLSRRGEAFCEECIQHEVGNPHRRYVRDVLFVLRLDRSRTRCVQARTSQAFYRWHLDANTQATNCPWFDSALQVTAPPHHRARRAAPLHPRQHITISAHTTIISRFQNNQTTNQKEVSNENTQKESPAC